MYYRIEHEPNQFVIRVYSERHKDNYISSATIRTYGDVGWISQVIGAGFYKAAKQPDTLKNLMKDLRIKTLAGYVTDIHARTMKMMLKDIANIKVEIHGECAGRKMQWITVNCL